MRSLYDENKWKNAEKITDPKGELMKAVKKSSVNAIMYDIKRTLSGVGFKINNVFDINGVNYLGKPLLFWKDKINEKYLIYAIYIDVEYIYMGYLWQDGREIKAVYIEHIYWETADRSELFSKINKYIEQIRAFAIEVENRTFFDETMKPHILFDDVQNVIQSGIGQIKE